MMGFLIWLEDRVIKEDTSRKLCIVINKKGRKHVYIPYSPDEQDERHEQVIEKREVERKGKIDEKAFMIKGSCRCKHCGTEQWAPWPEWRIYGLCFDCCHKKGRRIYCQITKKQKGE